MATDERGKCWGHDCQCVRDIFAAKLVQARTRRALQPWKRQVEYGVEVHEMRSDVNMEARFPNMRNAGTPAPLRVLHVRKLSDRGEVL